MRVFIAQAVLAATELQSGDTAIVPMPIVVIGALGGGSVTERSGHG
jgi:hypothetical protein